MTTDIHSAGAKPPQTLASPGPLAAVLDAMPTAMLLVDETHAVRYRNAAARRRLSDARDIDTALSNVGVDGPFAGWSQEIARSASSQDARRFRGVINPGGDARPRPVNVQIQPFDGAALGVPGAALVLLDDALHDEDAARRCEMSNRLAALGKLAAKVAHELSNPLDGILRYVNLALRCCDDAPESKVRTYLTESRTGLMRMIQIIGDLLEFSRTTDGAFDAADINQVVEQAIVSQTVAADARGAVIAADFRAREMPFVIGTRLYQICCNLIRNAIDAMPGGGRVTITTTLQDDHVVIEVADTGPGLPSAGDAIFEPFYTTKEPGAGTGLGLAICKEYAEAMQGTISAACGDDGGAVFTVRIPVDACQRRPALLGGRRKERAAAAEDGR